MCRSIKTLRSAEDPATDEEIRAAALQYVREVSGYRQPSRQNEEAFERAVEAVAQMGINPGPLYSQILKELLEDKLRGHLKSREDQEKFVKTLLTRFPEEQLI